uniref:SH2 domain-containing protein n=1 Tax=Heterorhabditis bacteriophora TaxID=37862 RepID=A0A1I7WPK4_HETBA
MPLDMQDEGYGGLSPDSSDCEYTEVDGTMSVVENLYFKKVFQSIYNAPSRLNNFRNCPSQMSSILLPQPLDVRAPKTKKIMNCNRQNPRMEMKDKNDGSATNFAYHPSNKNDIDADNKYIMWGLKAISQSVDNCGQNIPLTSGIDRLTKEVRHMKKIVGEMENVEKSVPIQSISEHEWSSSESSFIMFSGRNSSMSSILEQPRNSCEISLSKTLPVYTDRPSLLARGKGIATSQYHGEDGRYYYNSRHPDSPKSTRINSCMHRCLPFFEPFEVSSSVRDLYRLTTVDPVTTRTENYDMCDLISNGSGVRSFNHDMPQEKSLSCTGECEKSSSTSVKVTQTKPDKVRRRIGRGRVFSRAPSADLIYRRSQTRNRKTVIRNKPISVMSKEDGVMHEVQASTPTSCRENMSTSNVSDEVEGSKEQATLESLHISTQPVNSSPCKKSDSVPGRSTTRNLIKVPPFVSMSQQPTITFYKMLLPLATFRCHGSKFTVKNLDKRNVCIDRPWKKEYDRVINEASFVERSISKRM